MPGYCAYLRKSRADQEAEAHGEGDTLARHKAALLRAAAHYNLSIDRFYEEIRSGESIAARPVMCELLAAIERGEWAGVFVVEVERLARGDTIDQGTVARAFSLTGTRIYTPVKCYDPRNEFDTEYFEFGLFMSRREYQAINRRMQRGRTESVREGKFAGNVAPYGYERVKLDGQKGWTLHPHTDEAETVRLIFSLAAGTARPGAGAIARTLDALHIPTRKGGSWSAATVAGILRNPVYTGQVRWGARPTVKAITGGAVTCSRPRAQGVLAEGLHEPLVSRAMWETAQRHGTPVSARRTLQNPLAGLVLCGVCGAPMQRRPCPDGANGLLCTTAGCPTVGSSLALVQERLDEALRDWMVQLPPQDMPQPATSELYTRTAAQAARAADILARQRTTAYDLLEQGVYTPAVFTERIAALDVRLETLAQEQEHLTPPECATEQAKNLWEMYRRMDTPAEQNRLLHGLLAWVIYEKSAGGRWDADRRDAFTLRIFPKLEK